MSPAGSDRLLLMYTNTVGNRAELIRRWISHMNVPWLYVRISRSSDLMPRFSLLCADGSAEV